MNMNQLRYFTAVAEYRSFTRAASQYYITQTAITQQIRSLEDSLGVELFDRTTRPITLTPAGNTFLLDAKAILERMDQAAHRVQEASVGMVGTLRIGYTKGFERSNLSDQLRAFHAGYPNILISCYRCDTDVLAAGLLRGDYDMIFTWDSTNLAKNEAIACRLVERSPLVAALYESHPFARRTELWRKELNQEHFLYMTPSGSRDSFGDRHFLELYQKAGYQPDILFHSSDVESILMLVAAEEGISILPSYMTRKLTNADNLKFIPLSGPEEYMDVIAAWRKNETNPALKHFVNIS